MSECVKVIVRARPINSREKNEGTRICVEIDNKLNQVILKKPKEQSEIPKTFTYDTVYDWNSTQRQVYDESAFPLVESVIEGYNGTIFAYGQTGCGKTYTMMGLKDDLQERGIIPNAFDHIFGYINSIDTKTTKFLVRCSYLEIYNEDIRDLLGKDADKKLELKEDSQKGVFVKDLTTYIVKSISEIEKLMYQGSNNRKVGETAMNKDSSRSHSIFSIYFETSEADSDGESRIKVGKLNLVDLAGSERQSKTQATGIRLKEATKINLSLSALGNVISALVDGKSQHIPYRDSKLTRLLQDSLGGNTKTVMIAAISPSDFNYDETLSTLRYASRAKSIKNKPRINEDPKDALLKQYEEEIKLLKQLLQSSSGNQINQQQFNQSIKKMSEGGNIMIGANDDDESVDELLQKLERKGKKVKILDQESSKYRQECIEEEISQQEDDIEESNQNQQQKQHNNNTEEQENSVNQREQLEKLIKEMEERVVQGGQALTEQQKEQAKKQRQLQLKLKKERQKQKQLMEENLKKEEDLLLKEKQYNSLQEEVEENRKVIKILRQKYQQALDEVEDLQKENEYDKEDILDDLRDQEKEINFCQEVMKAVFKDHELNKIRNKSKYDENNKKWYLPPFFIKEKEVTLPKIKNSKGFVEGEQNKRDVIFEDEQRQPSQISSRQSIRDKRTSINSGQRFDPRGSRSNNAFVSTNYEYNNGRQTPMDYQIKHQRFKKLSNDQQLNSYSSYSDFDSKQYLKKNTKNQNVHLQPLNYQTNGLSNPPQSNVEDILRSQQIENHPIFNQGNMNIGKKNQLEKLNYNPHIQSSGNMNFSGNLSEYDPKSGSIQMSIQATLSIEPHRRKLAPVVANHNLGNSQEQNSIKRSNAGSKMQKK